MKTVPLTVRIKFVASHESSPAIVLHLYDVFGVRLTMPWLSFLYTSLFASLSDAAATGVSKLNDGNGGSPWTCALHGKYGPGLAFRYQPFQSTVGGVIAGRVPSRIDAQMLSLPLLAAPPLHGVCHDPLL